MEVKRTSEEIDEIVNNKRVWLRVDDMNNELYSKCHSPTVYNTSIRILTTNQYVPPYLKREIFTSKGKIILLSVNDIKKLCSFLRFSYVADEKHQYLYTQLENFTVKRSATQLNEKQLNEPITTSNAKDNIPECLEKEQKGGEHIFFIHNSNEEEIENADDADDDAKDVLIIKLKLEIGSLKNNIQMNNELTAKCKQQNEELQKLVKELEEKDALTKKLFAKEKNELEKQIQVLNNNEKLKIEIIAKSHQENEQLKKLVGNFEEKFKLMEAEMGTLNLTYQETKKDVTILQKKIEELAPSDDITGTFVLDNNEQTILLDFVKFANALAGMPQHPRLKRKSINKKIELIQKYQRNSEEIYKQCML